MIPSVLWQGCTFASSLTEQSTVLWSDNSNLHAFSNPTSSSLSSLARRYSYAGGAGRYLYLLSFLEGNWITNSDLAVTVGRLPLTMVRRSKNARAHRISVNIPTVFMHYSLQILCSSAAYLKTLKHDDVDYENTKSKPVGFELTCFGSSLTGWGWPRIACSCRPQMGDMCTSYSMTFMCVHCLTS